MVYIVSNINMVFLLETLKAREFESFSCLSVLTQYTQRGYNDNGCMFIIIKNVVYEGGLK